AASSELSWAGCWPWVFRAFPALPPVLMKYGQSQNQRKQMQKFQLMGAGGGIKNNRPGGAPAKEILLPAK
ncbi:MAG: hypothetical protein AAB666_01870, partial [Patescibacteria group bacterium]